MSCESLKYSRKFSIVFVFSIVAVAAVSLVGIGFVYADKNGDVVKDDNNVTKKDKKTVDKTEQKILNKIQKLEQKTSKSSKDIDDIDKLKLAKDWIKAKRNNDKEEKKRISKELHDSMPFDYLSNLSSTVEGDVNAGTSVIMSVKPASVSFVSYINEPLTQVAWVEPEVYTGSIEYSWDCRDNIDQTGYLDGTITGYTSSIYVVMNLNYPVDKTLGPQGLNCETRSYESDGSKVVMQELLDWSTGCVTDTSFDTSTSSVGATCNDLSVGSLVYIHAHLEYHSDLEFSFSPSEDILYIGN